MLISCGQQVNVSFTIYTCDVNDCRRVLNLSMLFVVVVVVVVVRCCRLLLLLLVAVVVFVVVGGGGCFCDLLVNDGIYGSKIWEQWRRMSLPFRHIDSRTDFISRRAN